MTIKEWVKDNAEGLMPEVMFTAEDLEHITMCCEHLYEWATLDRPLGSFLTAITDNNFRLACILADDVNRKALCLYAMFMLNRIPADKIREKANDR